MQNLADFCRTIAGLVRIGCKLALDWHWTGTGLAICGKIGKPDALLVKFRLICAILWAILKSGNASRQGD
jgi:hypothetical protein